MNQIVSWVSHQLKKGKQQQFVLSDITQIPTNETVVVEFSDSCSINVTRKAYQCSCGKKSCKHMQQLMKKTHTSSKSPQPSRFFRRLTIMSKDLDCPICFHKLSWDSKDTPYVCDNCGLAIHGSCCEKWKQSDLGKDWKRECWICKNTIVKFTEM